MPANAASQLRAVLPPDLAARLDLGQLAPVPTSFVGEALKWRYSDLLFTVPMEGRDAFVYVLVEHQSSSDPLMAFRMLRYVTRIWDAYLREHQQARRLPAVIRWSCTAARAHGTPRCSWRACSTWTRAPPARLGGTCPGSSSCSMICPAWASSSCGTGH